MGRKIHGSALTNFSLRFGMGFMTLNRQLVNLEPKLAEIFSSWDTTAMSLGKKMGNTEGNPDVKHQRAELKLQVLALQNPSP